MVSAATLAAASAAVRTAVAEVDPAAVPLVVIAGADPGSDLTTPLLDGDLCASVVRALLADNGLLNAVPFGITPDGPETAVTVARALMAAETLPSAVVVTLDGPSARLLT